MTTSPDTPFARVDRAKVERNIARLRAHLDALGVTWRPHVKTSKALEPTAMIFDGGTGPITVSTLAEAEFFADAGYTDILYAVGIAPTKLERVARLRRRGIDLTILLDTVAQAQAVADFATEHEESLPVLIEIDTDGHRAGVLPDDPQLLEIARVLTDGGAQTRGVMAHAGGSYFATTPQAQRAAAEQERRATVDAAERLRAAGHAAPVVSVGSTPTAHAAADLTGVTEVRAGNVVFFDLVMAGIGVCAIDDLALSVVATVIGRGPDDASILTDAGWTATSSDRGTGTQAVDQHLGLVTTDAGEVLPDLLMVGASQEHGVLAIRPGVERELPDLPVGTRVRILPIHACATAAQHDHYEVVTGEGEPVTERWERCHGW
ncbi:alanine racemase [Janibacter sp. Soil728]|uniref:alanine racemase n=1 Tax=Janibacter sp. Soil728 TaxID=1736393 RepID=UPI0006FB29DB|nr:alanine racemase [Janibacter sp. Soil728]KRE38249.1 alanine racemase [Janibacter sp. Soil728]